MARKKIDPIVGLGYEDKLTVQKSLPLFALWRSDLTLSEFKILDTYLSRIDSHKPEKRAIILEKGEIENALGIQKINNQDLKLRLKHLMGNVVEVPDKDENKGFQLVTLFEEAEAEQDDDGLWNVKLECTQKAMKYFFNIENLGYLRYKLRCITSLTSRYTYIMFIYLEANRFRKSWEISLEELKKILHCENEATYNEFRFFNVKRKKCTKKPNADTLTSLLKEGDLLKLFVLKLKPFRNNMRLQNSSKCPDLLTLSLFLMSRKAKLSAATCTATPSLLMWLQTIKSMSSCSSHVSISMHTDILLGALWINRSTIICYPQNATQRQIHAVKSKISIGTCCRS